jgi:hypothetical protein
MEGQSEKQAKVIALCSSVVVGAFAVVEIYKEIKKGLDKNK